MAKPQTLYERVFGTYGRLHDVRLAAFLRAGRETFLCYSGEPGRPYHTIEWVTGVGDRTLCGRDAARDPMMHCRAEEPFIAAGWPKCKRCAAVEAKRAREKREQTAARGHTKGDGGNA